MSYHSSAYPDDPTTDVVWLVTERILERIAQLPELSAGNCAVLAGFDEARPPQCVWLSEIVSEGLSIPVFTGARLPLDEEYRIKLEVEVLDLHELIDTQRRLAEIIGAICSSLRDAPDLDNLPGLRSALVTEKRRTCGLTVEGHQGVAQIVITVEIRLN